MDPKRLVPVGKVGAAHGLRGEVRFYVFNPASKAIRPGLEVVLRGKEEQVLRIESVRKAYKALLVKFATIADREMARKLTGCEVCVRREDLPEIGQDEFYYCDVIGLPVTTKDGRPLGRIVSMMKCATDIFVIQGDCGEVLVPVVEGFVEKIGPDVVVLGDEALE